VDNRFTRRQVLKHTAAAGAGAALAGMLPHSMEAAPRGGGVLRLALISSPVLNPIVLPSAFASLQVLKTMFNGLVRYSKKDLSPEPDLATSWSVSSNGLEWTFKLRDAVKWHDGKPFTAADVKFTYDAIANPKVTSYLRSNLAGIAATEVVDALTVRFRLQEPIASLPELLGYLNFIVPKHVLEAQDLNKPEAIMRAPVGTGPFRFKEQALGSHVVVTANPGYFLGKPHVDTIVFKVIPDVNTQVSQLLAGELDYAGLTPATSAPVEGNPRVQLSTADPTMYLYLALWNKHPVFSDKRVRQAVAYAIDREAILKNVYRGTGAKVAVGPVYPMLKTYFNPKVKRYDHDLERARALLREAGWTPGADGVLQQGGKKLSFELLVDRGNPTREQITIMIQQQLKAIGADPRLVMQEFAQVGSRSQTGRFEALVHWWVTPPTPDVYSYFACNARSNKWGSCNAELDRLLKEGRATTDVRRRKAVYDTVQELIAEDVPTVFLFHESEIRALSKRVHDWPSLDIRNAVLYLNEVWVDA
jgi:peptide/nickel transport system substrate-binding protein